MLCLNKTRPPFHSSPLDPTRLHSIPTRSGTRIDHNRFPSQTDKKRNVIKVIINPVPVASKLLPPLDHNTKNRSLDLLPQNYLPFLSRNFPFHFRVQIRNRVESRLVRSSRGTGGGTRGPEKNFILLILSPLGQKTVPSSWPALDRPTFVIPKS